MNLFMIVMYSYLIAMSIAVWFYYRTLLPGFTSWLWPLAVVGATASYLVSHSGYIVHPEPVARALAWIGNVWILFGFYSLILMLINGVLIIPAKILHWQVRFSTPFAMAGLALIVGVLAFGIYKAQNPIVRTEVVATDKIAADTRIVLATDLHLGHINAKGAAEDLCARVNALNPDVIVLGGDIVDERISYVLDNGSLGALGGLKAPLGVYAVYGNHDYMDTTPKELRKLLAESGITVLENESTVLPNGIKLTGLRDYSRDRGTEALEALAAGNADYYSILIDHQPRRLREAAALGYDMSLSGHTHAGQVWPFRYITSNMYIIDYGTAQVDNLTAIVSNGNGFWGPPVRTGPYPEIVLINLKKTN